MSKQVYSRDEVKVLLKETIRRKQAESISENNKSENTYTREEVEAIIRKDRETRKVS